MKRFLHALLFAAAGVQAETVRWTEVIRQKKTSNPNESARVRFEVCTYAKNGHRSVLFRLARTIFVC